MYEEEDGILAVKLARASIDRAVKGTPMPDIEIPKKFLECSGAFVTLNTYPKRELRGCIGYPEPYFPLEKSLISGAEGATRDPRFPALEESELDNVVVEVSLLSPPQKIKVKNPKDYHKLVKVGRHGLIVEQGMFRGLLLPQVPVEYGWNTEKFLSQTCLKAGLFPDAWLDSKTIIYSFTGDVFSEESPRGKVTRVVLNGP
ncbi:MAG: TIGR00296 family protein [Thermoplasmata archaeon]|nr:TIGR00296 family protein [Thermoplasmata archaeon]